MVLETISVVEIDWYVNVLDGELIAKDRTIEAAVPLLEREALNIRLEELDQTAISKELGFNFDIELIWTKLYWDPITSTISVADAGRRYLLKELTAGMLKEKLLKITKELFQPPDATMQGCIPTAEVVFVIKLEFEDQTVHWSDESPIFATIEASNLPQFEP